MIRIEAQGKSAWQILKEEYFAFRKEQLEKKRERTKKAEEMIHASAVYLKSLNSSDITGPIPAVRILMRNGQVRIDRNFEQNINVGFDGSEEWLLDFLHELTGESPKTFFSGYRGTKENRGTKTYDLEKVIPGFQLDRYLQPERVRRDGTHSRYSAIFYSFVKKGE